MHALLVVDVQNDFCPGGALEVPHGDEVVPFINGIRDRFGLVVFTQDWHPADHVSFASNHPGRQPFETMDLEGLEQILWPDHCVQRTPGAAFVAELDVRPDDPVIRKGDLSGIDSYSGFLDNDKQHETGLRRLLQDKGVDEVYITGVATDVCVKYTALDARQAGFRTHVYREGTRAVNQRPGDDERAYQQMAAAGVDVI